ncbi:p17 [Carnation yellow fleck virus]|uniref:p17 n=1 Tax=Carnation yellow fleck virus TaxID=940280 RepID=UPI0003C9CDA8|nr:p17 [Carnation yellow fleck virus]ADV40944.1 p17 [Carnation yellow fleck virus]BBK15494.1 p17 [Carnation yellow fleck virus]
MNAVEFAQPKEFFKILLLKDFVFYIVSIDCHAESTAELAVVYLQDFDLTFNRKGQVSSEPFDFENIVSKLNPKTLTYTRVRSGDTVGSQPVHALDSDSRLLNREVNFIFHQNVKLTFGLYGEEQYCVSSDYLQFGSKFIGAHCGTLSYCLLRELDSDNKNLVVGTFCA